MRLLAIALFVSALGAEAHETSKLAMLLIMLAGYVAGLVDVAKALRK